METFLIKALQLILSLSILVIVHEFGHFLFARLFKIRVEKFYLFFNPFFTLFKYKPKNSETEYGIGWLPLGGYVKIAGMIDESMDKEQMKLPAQPYEFRSKPAWQRLLVMVGGVLFNFILAIAIFSMVLFSSGDTYLPVKDITMGAEFSDVPKEVGFRDGDIVVSADGEELLYRDSRILDMNTLLKILNAKSVLVIRDGQEVNIDIPKDFMDRFVASGQGFWAFNRPTIVNSVAQGSAASIIGLKEDDRIISVNDTETPTYISFRKKMEDCKGKETTFIIIREGQRDTLTTQIDTTGTVGFFAKTPMEIYKTVHKDFSVFESFPGGINLGMETLTGYIAQFKLVFTKEGITKMGGFGAIGNLFPAQWDWYTFWMMTAFLSIMLGVMNILPIPALDGGHVMFLLYEVITRRKPNEKFMEYAQVVGMILLFGLIIFANGNDLYRAIFG